MKNKWIWIIGGLAVLNLFIFVFANRQESLGNQVNVRGREVEVIIDDFRGGITSDVNKGNINKFQLISNFEIRDGWLIPYRDAESADSGATINEIKSLIFGNGSLWGLGVAATSNYPISVEIFEKTGADLLNNTWSQKGIDNDAIRQPELGLPFVYYKNFLYGGDDSSSNPGFWRYGDITGTPTFLDDWKIINNGVNVGHFAQGLVFSKDDRLYLPWDNIISVYDRGTDHFIENGLILPSNQRINDIAEYGHFLAIATEAIGNAPLTDPAEGGLESSRVYLWDRNTSLTTISDNIEWGTGQLEIIEIIDGILVGISHSAVAESDNSPNTSFNSRITFRAYDGQKVIKLFDLVGTAPYLAEDLEIPSFKYQESLYFPLTITINGRIREGIWKFYRSDGGFILTMDRPITNNGIFSSAFGAGLSNENGNRGRIYGLFILDDYMFISYSESNAADDGNEISRTNDIASYTASSTIETSVFGDGIHQNILRSIGVMTETLPAGGQIDIYYKFDDGRWNLATSSRNIGAMFHRTERNEVNNIDFPLFTRAKFRVEVSGAPATTTGMRILYEILDDIL